ncbi:hypothetical protein GCM10010294_43950 [Streptomyces griseoloalbus]|nr:hypothetical protein GCM10010294_43950 [Streptomyces griseoloalbus]
MHHSRSPTFGRDQNAAPVHEPAARTRVNALAFTPPPDRPTPLVGGPQPSLRFGLSIFQEARAVTDRLLNTLATAMAQLITAIDMTSDEEVDPDVATTWFEDLADTLGELPPADRMRLAELFRAAAEQETRPDVRASMRELPEDFGLEDEDDR